MNKYPGIKEVKNKDLTISYFGTYRDLSGVPRRKLLGKKTKFISFSKRDAYFELQNIRHKLEHGIEIIQKKRNILELFDDFYEIVKKTKKTHIDDYYRFNSHIKPFYGTYVSKKINNTNLSKFFQYLIDKNLSIKSIHHIFSLLKQLISYDEILKNDIFSFKLPKIDNNRIAFLSRKQANQLLKLLKNSDLICYQLVVLLLFTGSRLSQITYLKWQQINFTTNQIYFPPQKNGNERYIAMHPLVKEVLNSLNIGDLYVFNNIERDRLPSSYMNTIEEIIPGNKSLELKYKITAHSLRHTHASWLAMDGLDILQIKEQLGHKTLEMTLRYSHLSPNIRHKYTEQLKLE